MHYHLILVVKYRRKVINDTISGRLRDVLEHISSGYRIKIEAWNHDIDHILVLFTGQPGSDLSRFIDTYKSASSRIIKGTFHIYGIICGKKRFGAGRTVF